MKSGRFPASDSAGALYFYIHFATELACFFLLGRAAAGEAMWLLALLYDAAAFVPQGLIGYLKDRGARIPLALCGAAAMLAALMLYFFCPGVPVWLTVLLTALGNAAVHVEGAEITLRTGGGRLTPAALFVGGGSFGLISGKLLAASGAGVWPAAAALLTIIPCAYFGEKYEKAVKESDRSCSGFNYAAKDCPEGFIIPAAVVIVAVRAYMGYGIPTAWNKTVWQTVLLYVFMGTGKVMGGVLTDRIGIRRTALISIFGALPFLLFGDKVMAVSLIGVMLFSMTMAVTLGVLVTELKELPGVAFGLTTIGLFAGTLPIFFVSVKALWANCVIITVCTALCALPALKILPVKSGADKGETENVTDKV